MTMWCMRITNAGHEIGDLFVQGTKRNELRGMEILESTVRVLYSETVILQTFCCLSSVVT